MQRDAPVIATFSGTQVQLRDARTGQGMSQLDHPATVTSVAFSADGTRVATGSEDGYARVHAMSGAREIARMALGEGVRSVEFATDDQLRVTTGTFQKSSETWNYRATLEPVEAADLIAVACARLTRNLTTAEWAEDIGGTYRERARHLPRQAPTPSPRIVECPPRSWGSSSSRWWARRRRWRRRSPARARTGWTSASASPSGARP